MKSTNTKIDNDKNIDYFKIVKKFIKIAIKERNFNPFHFDEINIENEIFCLYGKEKDTRKKFLELRNNKIKEYKKFLNWYINNNSYSPNMFKKKLILFRFYSYAIINNKIINDDKMKKKNGDLIKQHTIYYDTKFKEVFDNDYDLIFIEDLQNNEEPYCIRKGEYKYLQDKKGNYILPRIETEYNINSYYNVSNYFLKNIKRTK